MAPNPRRQDERLDALYAKLPELDCKGDCWLICRTHMRMSLRERARIEVEHGPVVANERGWCSMLSEYRCKAHALRPLRCRLWGMTEDTRCPHGCEPKPRFLTEREAEAFVLRADEVGGGSDREVDDRVWFPVSAFVGRT